LLAWIVCLLGGCARGNARVAAPALAPEAAGQAALEEYDTNGDGFLDGPELESCPALLAALKAIDKDGDGRLSAREIADRVAFYKESRVGLMTIACHVTLDGRPLVGATVKLIPEKFLGPEVKPADGLSDEKGRVQLQIDGEDLPGVHCGLYRVEVSKTNVKKQETLPARYNTQSVLGVEVAPGMRNGITLTLTSG
jgi:hypothetical protein